MSGEHFVESRMGVLVFGVRSEGFAEGVRSMDEIGFVEWSGEDFHVEWGLWRREKQGTLDGTSRSFEEDFGVEEKRHLF